MDENIPREENLVGNGNHGGNGVKLGAFLDSFENHGAEFLQVHFAAGGVTPAIGFSEQSSNAVPPWNLIPQSH